MPRGPPPGTRRRAPRGSAARCGAVRGSLPRRSPQVGRGGQGAASPPPRPRSPFSISRVALGARSALGGRGGAGDVDGGLGGERLGMGNEKGRCQKESEEEVAVPGKDAPRPPFRPSGAGGCQEVAQMLGSCEGSPAEGPGDCSQAQGGSGQPPGTLQSPQLVAFWSPGHGCQGVGIGVLWARGAARGRQGCEPLCVPQIVRPKGRGSNHTERSPRVLWDWWSWRAGRQCGVGSVVLVPQGVPARWGAQELAHCSSSAAAGELPLASAA